MASSKAGFDDQLGLVPFTTLPRSTSDDHAAYKFSDVRESNNSQLSFEMLWRRNRAWALPAFLSFFLVLLTWPAAKISVASGITNRAVQAEPPRHSTNLTNSVQWDNYTLFVNQQRIFLQ